MEDIVEELKMLRQSKHITITEVAQRIGTSRQKISEIENGRGGLTLKRMLEYADALGLKVTIKFEKI